MKKNISLRQRALNILSRQEVSRFTLKQKLQPYCTDETELQSLLDEFAERHWQSDARFTEAYIHSKSHLYGYHRLKQALIQLGVDEDLIQDYLSNNHHDQLKTAVAILRKKYSHPPEDHQQKYKYMNFLAYRGFEFDIIHQALKQAWNSDEYDSTFND